MNSNVNAAQRIYIKIVESQELLWPDNSVVSIDELSLLNAGINTSGRIESKPKVKSPLLFEPNIMHLDSKTTIEDILNYKKTDIQSYLKSKGKK